MRKLSTALYALICTLTINLNSLAMTETDTPNQEDGATLTIFAIYHDDVPAAKKSTIHSDYIEPFTKEFESITGRKIRVIVDQDKPPYSNFDYRKSNTSETILEWLTLSNRYKQERDENNESLYSYNDRVILITNNLLAGSSLLGGTAGIAFAGTPAAIASLGSKRTLGHELGHTFNAIHADGEIKYNGWWCETFMYTPRLPLRADCNVFSQSNRQRIKTYVDSLFDGLNVHEIPEEDITILD